MDSLFPFQETGARWLAQKKFALLADEMRLGKSPQTVVAAESLGLEKILVICPAVARINWQREFYRWGDLFRVKILLKTTDEPDPACVNVCSFEYATENLHRLASNDLYWDLVVIDEVHFLKSKEAKRSRKIFGKDGIVRRTARVWALSGTPAPNNASELWILLYTFGATPLSYDRFVERYCDTIWTGFGRQIVGTKKSAIPELKALLAKVMLRRLMRDVRPEVPELQIAPMVVEPGRVEVSKELEEKLEKERGQVEKALIAALSPEEQLAMLEALAQSVSTLRRYSGLQKVDPAAELVSGELALKLLDKIVIFAVHREVVEKLKEKLSKWCPVVLYGGMSAGEKQRAQDVFRADPRVRVFIGNIQAAGTNIDLSVAHHVLFVEQEWVPGHNAQAARRCMNVKKLDPVNVRFLTLATPMDEKVTRVLEKKTVELSKIFDD